MKRLRDIEQPSALVSKAQSLIEAAPPLEESEARMLRVRRRLDEPRGMSFALRRMSALSVAALLLLFGASAFAALRYFAQRPTEPAAEHAPARAMEPAITAPIVVPTPTPTPTPTRPSDTAAPTAHEGTAHETAKREASKHELLRKPTRSTLDQLTQPSATSTPDATPTAPNETEQVSARQAQNAREATEAPKLTRAPAKASDGELVHRALKALRRDGNPALAARLLEQNRALYPEGPLAEEALSLQIEAADAMHDARAHAFAMEYLKRYPTGRYRPLASRIMSRDHVQLGTAP